MHNQGILAAAKGVAKEEKYEYMLKAGGVGNWFLLPILTMPSPIPKKQLSKIEDRIIAQTVPNLNRGFRHRHKAAPKGSTRLPILLRSAEKRRQPKRPPQPGSLDSVIDMVVTVQRTMCELPVIIMDIYEAFRVGTVIKFHRSRPIMWTEITRVWGQSTVDSFSQYGDNFFGTLKQFTTAIKFWTGNITVHFLIKWAHPLRYSDHRLWLRHIAFHKYGRRSTVYSDLTAAELWSLWKVSSAECTEAVHNINVKIVSRALRDKGVRITPVSDLVVRIPPGVEASKKDVVVALKEKLKRSFLPLAICDYILTHVRVVKGKSVTIASLLTSHNKWIKMLEFGDLD